MPRVHHIINTYSLSAGGAERMVRSLHLGLLERNTESLLVGLMRETDHIDKAQSLGLDWVYDFRGIFRLGMYIFRNVESDDIVHAHLFPANLYVSVLSQLGLVSCKVVATEHSTRNGRRDRWIGKLIDTFLYRAFERIYAISDAVAHSLCGWVGGVSRKIQVIENGVPLRFQEAISRKDDGFPVILSVGNLRDAKNYDVMLRAVALLETPFEYWIAGEGENREKLERLVNKLGIDRYVKFMGYVENTEFCLRRATIFLIASKWEGFGMAAVEAMNAALPIVASDVPGLRDVLKSDPPCCLLVDPSSPEDVADSLQKLIESSTSRKEIGSAGFERSSEFSETRMVAQYIKAYRDLSAS